MRTPIFEDGSGRRCAVAHLLAASGASDVVDAVRERQNLARVHEIDHPMLAEWARAHGLTVDELEEIQPGYEPAGVQAWYVLLSGLSAIGAIMGFALLGRPSRSSSRIGLLAAVLSLAFAVALATKMMTIGVRYAIPPLGMPVAGILLFVSTVVASRWIWRATK
jgi:hypothetical protein